jgi:hypothetical protein
LRISSSKNRTYIRSACGGAMPPQASLEINM